MEKDRVRSRVRALLSYYTGVPEADIPADASRENLAGWDSVANLSVLTAVEEEFAFTISTRDAMRLSTLASIVQLVEQRAAS